MHFGERSIIPKWLHYTKKMINFRDEITKNIEINNAKSNAEIQIQAVNGLARIKKYFDKNPERLNFWEEHSFHDKAHNEYRFIQMRIRNHARSFQKDLEQN